MVEPSTSCGIDGDAIAGLEQMATHRRAHDAGADPADCACAGVTLSGASVIGCFASSSSGVILIRHRLNDAFSLSRHLHPLKTQIVAPVTRRLDRGSEFNPLPVFDIGVFDGRDSANAVDGDVDRGCFIFQVKQIGAIAHRAGLELVGIERRHIANSALQRDLFQMKDSARRGSREW